MADADSGPRDADGRPGDEGAPEFPAGWYPNPEGTRHRYWDGLGWTEHYSPAFRQKDGGRGRSGWFVALVVGGVVAGVVALLLVGSVVLYLVEAEEVPSVVGLERTEATQKVERAGLDVTVEGEPRRGDEVCEQDPVPGESDIEVTLRFRSACGAVRRARELRAEARKEQARRAARSRRAARERRARRRARQREATAKRVKRRKEREQEQARRSRRSRLNPPGVPGSAIQDAEAQLIGTIRGALGGYAIVNVRCSATGPETISCIGRIEDTISGTTQSFYTRGNYDPSTGEVTLSPETPIG